MRPTFVGSLASTLLLVIKSRCISSLAITVQVARDSGVLDSHLDWIYLYLSSTKEMANIIHALPTTAPNQVHVSFEVKKKNYVF